jgi:O-antigen ligase
VENTLGVKKITGIDKFLLFCISVLILYPPYLRGLFFEKEFIPTSMAIIVVGLIWILTKKNNKIIKSLSDMFVLGLWLMYLISITYGVNIRLAIGEALRYSAYFVIYYVVRYYANKDRKIKHVLLNIILISGFGVALVGIGCAIGTWSYNGAYTWGRLNSTLQYTNALASYMCVLFFIGVYYASDRYNLKHKCLYGILCTTFFFAFVLTYSRAMFLMVIPLMLLYVIIDNNSIKILLYNISYALVGTGFALLFHKSLKNNNGAISWSIYGTMLVVTILVTYLNYKMRFRFSRIKKKTIYICIGIIILISSIIGTSFVVDLDKIGTDQEVNIVTKTIIKVTPKPLMERFLMVGNREKNVEGRITFYKDASKIIKDYPLFGTGGGGWKTLYPMYQSFDYYTTEAHSYFVQMFVETGLIGIGSFTMIILLLIKDLFKIKKYKLDSMKISIFISIMTFIIHSLVDFDLSLSALSLVLWALIGIYVEDDKLTDQKISWKYLVLAVMLISLVGSTSIYWASVNGERAAAIVRQDLGKGIEYLVAATESDPFEAKYKSDLGRFYMAAGKKQEAKNQFDKAVELSSYDRNILRNAMSFYLRTGYLEEGLKIADRLVEVQPLKLQNYEIKSDVYYEAGKLMYEKDRKEESREYYKKVIEVENQFNEFSKKSIKPMELSEKTKNNIEGSKKELKEKF